MSNSAEKPYILKQKIVRFVCYNPKYGDDRVCKCGHSYYRHFDWSEEYAPVGCKYCYCPTFKEK